MTRHKRKSAGRGAIIAIVKGGLGNQFFIYAAARALALRTGRDLYLDAELGYQDDRYGRRYRLQHFPVRATLLPEEWRIAPSLRHPRHRLVRMANKLLPIRWRTYLAESHLDSPETMARYRPARRRVTLVGYWQNETFFADQAIRIREELTPPLPEDEETRIRGETLAGQESVLVHVRRHRYSPLLGADYYQAAIDEAREKLDSPVFVLFGDDPDWALARLDFGTARVEVRSCDVDDELRDLWLMTRCRHAIIANSTFSWWGAWLGGEAGRQRLIWTPASTGLPLQGAAGWRRLPASLDYVDKCA
ncbi:MAG: alpha-1,2-fucosyltransferase [Gammaproteobacteria bacterium]|nr:MAG: alpha-1,2-fucosyltransferase [Gammaproteobacteria bacterium]